MNIDILNELTHELKNPLSVCKGYLDMINNTDDISKQKYLAIIKDEIKRSLDILAHYKDKNLNIENINLINLYKDVINVFEPYFLKHNAKIILLDNKKIFIKGDYNKLKQVFVNIIKNSYEAKRNNEELLVIIKTISLNKIIRIIITDNGYGMSKKELKNIYNKYYTTKKNGTGIGVPFSNEIINLHGGKIEYSSKKNKGTKVIIDFPRKKSPKTF